MKKSFKKLGKTDSVKMYTWSPYTSNLFFSDPKMVNMSMTGAADASVSMPHPHDMGLQF